MLVVLIALGVAFWRELDVTESTPGVQAAETSRDRRDADTAQALAGPRARADLPPCPVSNGPGPQPLRGITLECAGDGANVEVAKAVAGRTTILNLWAYWCAPCAKELPAMAEYQRRVGPSVTVLTVHQDENEEAEIGRAHV